MARYVDGFVMPLPKANVERYREIATAAGELWKEHGALEYTECIAEDVKPGELTSFPQSVKLEDDETVIFAWITYESRDAARRHQREGHGGRADEGVDGVGRGHRRHEAR